MTEPGWSFTDGFTEEELKAQGAFEAQLLHTAKMISRMIPNHRHYTDDCGDYLVSALELSKELAIQRAEGMDAFLKYMEKLQTEEDEESFFSEWASDGISPGLMEYLGIKP